MTPILALIIFIEFLVIVILSIAIKSYANEKLFVRQQSLKYADLLRKVTQAGNAFLEKAFEVRHHVSQTMYRHTVKKNQIVKQACTQFYKELADRML